MIFDLVILVDFCKNFPYFDDFDLIFFGTQIRLAKMKRIRFLLFIFGQIFLSGSALGMRIRISIQEAKWCGTPPGFYSQTKTFEGTVHEKIYISQ